MTRRKRNRRWPAAVVLALAAGCGYWVLAGGCTAPGGGGGGGGGSETEEPANGNEDGLDGVDANENEGAPDEADANENEAGPDEANTNESDAQGLVVTEAACTQLDSEGYEFETRVDGVSDQGRELSYTSRVITNPDQDASVQIETEVTADGELVMRITTSVDGMGDVQVDVEYGPLVPGLDSASAVVEDGVLSGSVDGRAIVPMPVDDEFDAATVSLEDGDPPPELGMDPDLEAAVTDLFEPAAVAAEGCQAVTMSIPRPLPLIPQQDHGHDSDPEASGECIACWGGCSAGFGTCSGVAAAACVAAGPFYALCIAPAMITCGTVYATCQYGCYNIGAKPCCPVDCGEVACCDDNEVCLNAQIGLCCSPGKTPCMGESCCGSTEVCIDSGPNAGTCCQPEDICGNTCCDPTDSCSAEISLCCSASEYICGSTCCDATDSCIADISLCCPAGQAPCDNSCCPTGEDCLGNGLCCDPQNICGSVCCDDLDSGCIPELSLCCGFDQDVCGNTCCAIGESCVTGTTCCPDARICGDLCCPEGNGCDSQTGQCTPCPNPTDTPCIVGGCCPAGTFCQDVEGFCCDPGEICCNVTCSGGCRPISECIN